MRQIKFDENEKSYNGKNIRDRYLDIWSKKFINETSKFISSTLLKPEDLGKEFQDDKGISWKILGWTEQSRELACEKIETREIFLWDRWKVSNYVRPSDHARTEQKLELIFPTKKKTRKKKDPIEKVELQLDLFSSAVDHDTVKIISAKYGAETMEIDVIDKFLEFFVKGENIIVSDILGKTKRGKDKKLTVCYTIGEESVTKSFPEKSIVRI